MKNRFDTAGNGSSCEPVKENIFFLHINKCGGTSISQAIGSCFGSGPNSHKFHLCSKTNKIATKRILDQSNVPDEQTKYLSPKFREYMLLYQMGRGIKYIDGHFRFSDIAHQNYSHKYAFVTVLRDPVERFISAYFHKRFKKCTTDLNWTDYLKQKEFCESEGFKYVQVLSGIDDIGDHTCPSSLAIAKAKENLHKFRVVGCLEYQDIFLDQFEDQFGKRLKLQTLNKSRAQDSDRRPVSEEVAEEIKKICKPDIEIYEYAVDNFVEVGN